MRNLGLAFKRNLSRGAAWFLILLCPLMCFLASRLPEAERSPLAGMYLSGDGECVRRIEDYLSSQNFVKYDDTELMREHVRSGELDCAVIFPEDVEERIQKGELRESVIFIESPTSFMPGLFRNHAAAALFREYAPYIGASAFESTQLSREDMLREYEKLFAEGYSFSFELSSVDGNIQQTQLKKSAMVKGAVSVLMCVLVFCLCADNYEKSFRPMAARLGAKRSFTAVLVPGSVSCAALAWISGAAAVCLAGMPELLPAVLIYGAVLTVLGTILAMLLPKSRHLYIILPLLVAFSAALCPIYIDLSLFVPAVAAVRNILPSYWLWLISEKPLPWLALCIAFSALVPALLWLRGRLSVKMRV